MTTASEGLRRRLAASADRGGRGTVVRAILTAAVFLIVVGVRL
jgi:hypothetical protein